MYVCVLEIRIVMLEIYKENNLFGLRKDGKVIIEPQYLELGNFREGVGVVRNTEFQYSYITTNGFLFFPFGQLSWCEPFRYGFARFKVGDKFGVLSIRNIMSANRKSYKPVIRKVVAPVYDDIWSLNKPEYLDCLNATYKGKYKSLNLPALLGGRDLNGLEYIHTYEIEDFKNMVGVEKVEVKSCKVSGRLFFLFGSNWGEVATKWIPSKPKISLVVNSSNEMFFLLHDADECFETFDVASYKATKVKSERNSYYYDEPDMSCDDEWKELLEDAFDGESDAYWNID